MNSIRWLPVTDHNVAVTFDRQVGQSQRRPNRRNNSLQSRIRSGELLAQPGHPARWVAAIAVDRTIDESLQPW